MEKRKVRNKNRMLQNSWETEFVCIFCKKNDAIRLICYIIDIFLNATIIIVTI